MHKKITQLAVAAFALFSMSAFPQSPPSNLVVPNQDVNQGTLAYEATNSITTGTNFQIDNLLYGTGQTASVLFQVLNTSNTTITLLPGFTAIAGNQPGSPTITFKALIGPLATPPVPVNGSQPVNTPYSIPPFTANNTGGSNLIVGGYVTFLATDGSGAQCPVEFVVGQGGTSTLTLLDTGTTSDGVCTINAGSSISAGSEVVTVNLNLTFTYPTPETYTITTDAIDTAGNLFPFLAAGTWTVTGPWNFTMTAPSLSSVTVTPTGAQSSYNQTFQGINGFSGPVSLTYKYNGGNLPAGLSFSLNSLTVSGPTAITAPITVSAGYATTAGTYPISITAVGAGSSGTITQTSSVTVVVTQPPSFNISWPTEFQIANNSTWTGFSQIITTTNGFNSPVTVYPFQYEDVSGKPYALNGPVNVSYGQQYWTPNPITGTVNVNGMLQSPTGSATGFFYYDCYATGGGVQQYFKIPVYVTSTSQNSDFTLTPGSQSVQVTDGGSSFSFPVTISAINTPNLNWPGSFTTIGTSPPGWPSNVNVAVSPSTFSTLPASATVTITAYSGAPTGTYSPQISVAATNPNTQSQVTHSIPITLTIGNVPTFTLSASPGSQTANTQSKASYQVNVNAENGFNSPVSFSASGLPNGATYALTPSTVSGTGATVLTVTVPPVLSTTTYNFVVAGTSGSISQSAQLSLTLNGTGTTPATMTVPSNGSVLSSGTPVTFSWGGGNGVSQYSLSAGSSQGTTDILSPQNLSAGVTSLGNVAIPSGAQQVNVTLGSLINSQWYYGQYTYGTSASIGFNSEIMGIPDAQNFTIANNDTAFTETLNSPNGRNYTGFAGSSNSYCPQLPCKCTAYGSGLGAQITSVDSGGGSMQMQFTADDTIVPGAGTATHYAGAYPVICQFKNQTTAPVEIADITVVDGTPVIDPTSPTLLSPLYAGGSAEFTLTGYNLGATGQLLFCHSGTGACDQSINSTNSNSDVQYTVNSWALGGSAGRDTINVSLTASQGAYGSYDVELQSGGAAGINISTLLAEDQTPQEVQAQGPSVSAPTITTISPAMIPVATSTDIMISGTGLLGVNTVTAQGVTFTIKSKSQTGTQIAATAAVNSNDKGGTVSLTVSTGASTSNSVNLKKQVPSRLVRLDYPGAPGGVGPLQTPVNQNVVDLNGNVLLADQCGVYRWYVYGLVDQDGQPMSAAFTLNEVFSNYSGVGGPGYSLPFTPVTYDPTDQYLADIQFLGKPSPSCLGPNDNETFNQGFTITISGTVFNLSTVINIQRGNFGGNLQVNESVTTQ